MTLLIVAHGFCQETSSEYFSDSIDAQKKEINSNTKIEIGLSNHKYDIHYRIAPKFITAQIEDAISFHIGYQYMNDYVSVGVLGKKGFFHGRSQPPGSVQVNALSYPWILEFGGAFNAFYFREREFFLGPYVHWSFLYDSKHNHNSSFLGLGFIIRKKWFTFRLSTHKILYTGNDHYKSFTEESQGSSIGIIIPVYKVKETIMK